MKKVLIVIYGIIAYLIFLVAFLYAIGFVGNLFVPKSIDTGEEISLVPAVLINLGLLSLFALQHSIMARPAFKKWFTKIIDPAMERSTYILLSSLILLFMYWKWQPMTTIVWDTENIVSLIVMAIFFLGWTIVFLSTFMISHFELFGLTQIYQNFKNQSLTYPEFQVNWFYKLVRHPLMLGFIIAFWAAPTMTYGRLLFAVVTTAYMLIAVKYLEEKDLRNLLGKDYENYQKRVPMIFPFTKFKKG
ncbi:MAG: methanethiol S-methyltransferase [Maribacter stanieri]|jgi:protein-S-isoprenylcysteine O-methyltransferase Ste14|uniref:methanethiol S-methyltransferase n=1 Tax=Maribacter stanieri TaxID=440514 RepID=UPI0024953296|nr:methanethiol S-methyltransferase [Maribacter stanieri]|tara:strand:+ start:2759 stop:3496 length:738 start_codon:yes stop_codon:yes gene_type:complete